MWCIGRITARYRQRMYQLLELYQQAYDADRPVVCMDEKSKQLLQPTTAPLPPKPGRPAFHDYEYRRCGTRNIFVAVEPKAGKRITKVTPTRKKADFAHFIRTLVQQEYPGATEIRLVLDNLNTHFAGSLYETFSPAEAEQILQKITFYYTPIHGSWLNMAEIELAAMQRECLPDRIATEQQLSQQLQAWTRQRNAEKKTIQWRFTRQDADQKLSHHYAP